MAKIVRKTLSFDAPEVTDDVVLYNIYYSEDAVNYDSPKLNIPAVEGQETYSLVLDGENLPIIEGNYTIGVSSVDAYGNESDIEDIVYPFDFTPPPPVSKKRQYFYFQQMRG